VAAAVLAFLALSHWVLDFITHRPDLPLYPGGSRYGLTLWRSVPLTMLVELAIFVAGTWLYAQATRPRDGRGQYAFISLVGVLIVAYVANIMSTPPSVTAVWSAGIVGFLLLLCWGAWADRYRVPVS
jgi:uncharacterized membrane protein